MTLIGIGATILIFGLAVATRYALGDEKRMERFRALARVRDQDIID